MNVGKMDDPALSFETRAAQAGGRIRINDTIATVGPIAASSTFSYDSVDGVHAALASGGDLYAYSRNANPTVGALEQVLASLEGAHVAVAFGSGMAAMNGALLATGLESGDTVVVARDLYGVTRSLLAHLQGFGINYVAVDVLDLPSVADALREDPARILCFESISNPLLRVPDIPALIEVAHANGARVVIDNTFASPYLFRPIESGADLVVHSATKYIAGHGDVTAGYVAANRSFGRRLHDVRTVLGNILSPFDAWLTIRGVKTLPLRMERQCTSAFEIARRLHDLPWIERVYYPGLHEGVDLTHAQESFGGRYGAMIAFDVRADERATLRFMDCLELITAGTSLGDAMSLILYPKLSSHRTLSAAERSASGLGDSLLRLSIGLESPADLLHDLERAARRAGIVEEVSAAMMP